MECDDVRPCHEGRSCERERRCWIAPLLYKSRVGDALLTDRPGDLEASAAGPGRQGNRPTRARSAPRVPRIFGAAARLPGCMASAAIGGAAARLHGICGHRWTSVAQQPGCLASVGIGGAAARLPGIGGRSKLRPYGLSVDGRRDHIVAPRIHGLNSSSPMPCASESECSPEATAISFSKISRPTSATLAPSRMRPASMSMSSRMRW